ncbi:DNA internalization-related competence protein ComEC/Rec2 [Desulfobulbus alkaliphilus]|uniref:DNA internalization-related competence protein ComEC/Rec2 n=1 Tax=Desulfobulbus alkaliphilus TaxID=869814 RepID=UPI0019634649|nr:DNA internalization-related competence protein ComEC/Rec2 [Desulfobulbus alkaliphilus]MBM9537955.1 DNA internalization-related competence protein ComEC/Rec2 [Desulfobulbus alkaliphilus]
MHRLLHICTENLLISATLCFLAGACSAFFLSTSSTHLPLFNLTLLMVPALVFAAFFLGRQLRLLVPLPLFFLVGLFHTHLALQPPTDPHTLATLIEQRTRVTLVGRILSMVEDNGVNSRFDLATESLLIHDNTGNASFQPARGTARLSVRGSLDREYTPGTKIMVLATLDRVRRYQTPGALDVKMLMASRSIHCSGWIQSPNDILRIQEPPLSHRDRLRFVPEQVRQHVADFLLLRLEPTSAGLYQALLVGSRVNIDPRTLEAFKASGCMHILAISGLHLSLLGLFTVAVFTLALKRSQWLLLRTHVPTLALALTAPILLFYAFIAGMNTPAFRALVTALLVLFAVLVRRQHTLIHLIAAAALVILAVNPLALFTASFQLSFAAVLAINLIYPRLPILKDVDTATPPRPRIRQGLAVLQSMLYVSLAATAGTLPVLLYHFNRVSLIGPLMNLAVQPLLCLWALPWGLAALPIIPLSPDLAALMLKTGAIGIHLAVTLTETVSGFSLASIRAISPNAFEMLLFAMVLVLVLFPRPIKALHLIPALLLTSLLLLSFTHSLWYPNRPRHLTVSYLDVGQGSATLLRLPNGKNVLIDGGGYASERFNVGQSVIGPYLWRQRIWRIHDLIITHPHQDHYNGLPFVYEHFRPQHLFINSDPGNEPAYQDFLDQVRGNDTPVQHVAAGDILHQDHHSRLECLGMDGLLNDSHSWSTNDRSLVFMLQHGDRRFLFPGDIEARSERRLLSHGPLLSADILLAPHHGSLTSGNEDFIAAVSPAMIVVSSGLARQGILPAPARLEQWQRQRIPTLITAQNGTVTATTDGTTLRIKTFDGKESIFFDTVGNSREKSALKQTKIYGKVRDIRRSLQRKNSSP